MSRLHLIWNRCTTIATVIACSDTHYKPLPLKSISSICFAAKLNIANSASDFVISSTKFAPKASTLQLNFRKPYEIIRHTRIILFWWPFFLSLLLFHFGLLIAIIWCLVSVVCCRFFRLQNKQIIKNDANIEMFYLAALAAIVLCISVHTVTHIDHHFIAVHFISCSAYELQWWRYFYVKHIMSWIVNDKNCFQIQHLLLTDETEWIRSITFHMKLKFGRDEWKECDNTSAFIQSMFA